MNYCFALKSSFVICEASERTSGLFYDLFERGRNFLLCQIVCINTYFLYSILNVTFNGLGTSTSSCDVWWMLMAIWIQNNSKERRGQRSSKTIFSFFTQSHSCNDFYEAVDEFKLRENWKKRINIQRWLLSPRVLKFLHITGRIYRTCILVYRQAI